MVDYAPSVYPSLKLVYVLISLYYTCFGNMVFYSVVQHIMRTIDCTHCLCMCMLGTYCWCSSCAIVCFFVWCLCHATAEFSKLNIRDPYISCCYVHYICFDTCAGMDTCLLSIAIHTLHLVCVVWYVVRCIAYRVYYDLMKSLHYI